MRLPGRNFLDKFLLLLTQALLINVNSLLQKRCLRTKRISFTLISTRLRKRGIYHTRYRTRLIIFRVFKNAFRGFHIAYVPRGKTPYFFPSRRRDFRECGVCVQSHDPFGNSIEGNTDVTLSIPSKRFRRSLSLSRLSRLTPSEGN